MKFITASTIIGFMLGTIGAICYIIAGFIFEMAIGSPSSTSALIVIAVPFIAGVSGLIGCGIGFLIGQIVNSIFKINIIDRKKIYNLLLKLGLVTIIISVLSGYSTVKLYVNSNSPKVIQNTGVFRKITCQSLLENIVITSEYFNRKDEDRNMLADNYKLPPSEYRVEWGNRSYCIEKKEHEIIIKNEDRGIVIRESLKGYDYIFGLIPVIIKTHNTGDEYLFVIARLRPTLFREILLVYDNSNVLILKEIIEDLSKVEKGKDKDTSEELLVLTFISGECYIYRK